LTPWEDTLATVWGAALAAYAVRLAPGYLDTMSSEDRAHLARLDALLVTRAADPETPLHHRAMIAIAAPAAVDALAIRRAIAQLQRPDGSWDAASLGVGGGHDAHAYATAFYTFVLATLGDRDAAERGRTWLRAHEQGGAWLAPSISHPDKDFNNQLMSDAA